MIYRKLIGTVFLAAVATPPAWAQINPDNSEPINAEATGSTDALEDEDYIEDEIVVAGQKPRGSVAADVEPEITLNGRDIRALGVGNISELLSELAPQLSSVRGGPPVVLLEGRRISSFREIASLPSEAVARAEILPEEVALSYGYPADQKVLNIVLRQRFRAVTTELGNRFSTQGGGHRLSADLGLLTINRDERINISAAYQQGDMLTEAQRDIFTDTGEDTRRSLQPSSERLTLSGSYARNLSQKTAASLSAELSNDRSFSLSGLSPVPELDVFTRTSNDLSAQIGGTLNTVFGKWNGTLTSGYEHTEGKTISVRGIPSELARSSSDSANADFTLNGNIYRLPAGQISLTARLAGTYDAFQSVSTRGVAPRQENELDRGTGLGSLTLNVPLIKNPSPFIGKLSVNGRIEHRELSDFGGLTNYSGGFNWVPNPVVRLIGSYARAETAPTMQQLGATQIVTPLVPAFDFTTGQSVLVTLISGGNPNLREAVKDNWSLGLTLKPLSKADLTLTVGYNDSRTKGGILNLSSLTAQTALAFPDRFVRDDLGNLITIETTPVNIARQSSKVLRWGFNFSKPLKTPQAQLDAMRAMFEQRRALREAAEAAGEGTPAGAEGERRSRREGGFGGPGGGGGRGGFGGGGGRGGGGGGGRLTFALYHSWHIEERAQLREGLPTINLLDGGSIGGRAGQPRHEVELQAGVTQSGIGLRLSGNWQSASRVTDPAGNPAGNLRFDDLATLNLRAFVTPSQLPGMMGKHPWMRGLRATVSVNNLFNSQQKVTDGTGETPFAYLPAFQDPLGRTVLVSVRKQF